MWLSNVVLANKARSDHCMCVNFTDVNIATPKDYAPLPNIDQLVNAIARFEVMNFMDAYSGYQKSECTLRMRKKQQSSQRRELFVTQECFLGGKMQVIYQRLVNKMF